MPLVGVWREGAFAFCTGPEEQKHRNLEGNPHVAVTTGSTGAHGGGTGKDVVVEGSHSGGSSEGGAHVFRVPPAKVLVFGDEHGQTAYRF